MKSKYTYYVNGKEIKWKELSKLARNLKRMPFITLTKEEAIITLKEHGYDAWIDVRG